MICPKLAHSIEVNTCTEAKRKTGESLGFFFVESFEVGYAVEWGIKPAQLTEKTKVRYVSYVRLNPGGYDVVLTSSSMQGVLAIIDAKPRIKP